MRLKHLFRVIPDRKRASFGAFLTSVGIDHNVTDLISEMDVEHVDVDVADHSWTIQLRSSQSNHSGDERSVTDVISNMEKRLRETLSSVNNVRLKLVQNNGEGLPGQTLEPWIDEEEDDYMLSILERAKNWTDHGGGSESAGSNNGKRNSRSGQILLGRKIDTKPVEIKQIQEEERSVVFEGEVIFIDVKELRSGRKLVTFDITDLTDSISIKLWEDEGEERLSKLLSPGDWVRVRGGAQVDGYTGELTILPRDCMRVEAPEGRMDTAEAPRVELHLHTKMSALDGALEVKPLFKLLEKWGHTAVAITDHGGVQAFPEAYAEAKRTGIKLIYGVEGYLVETEAKDSKMYHIILLAATEQGLVNLYRLVSEAHMNYFYRRPRLPRALIEKHREGLIIGSACEAGELYQAILNNHSQHEIDQIAGFYDYLEIQPLANNLFHLDEGNLQTEDDLREINRKIVELAEKLGKPIVATGDVHFLFPEDEVFRDIIMAGHGFDVERSTPLYFRTTEEMLKEFSYLGEEKAYEVVVTGPQSIADRIDAMRPIPEGFHPPTLPGAEDEIRKLAAATMKQTYGDRPPDIVVERHENELSSIINNGYASLYLIAHRLVNQSLSDGYLVGSRGSVGSSFAATMCGITEVNPLPPHYVCEQCHHFELVDDGSYGAGPDLPEKECPNCHIRLEREGYDIPFETFLGFHGDKVPDIDLNFSGDYQPKAHRYAEKMLGRDRVFRAGTIARLAERTAFGYVKNYLDARNVHARNAEINRLIRGCSGIRRTTGQHPGGLMVVPEGREIFEFTPIQYPADRGGGEVITTHFDCDTIDDTLVKLDILGHDDPTILKMLGDMTGVDVRQVPVDDPQTLQLFSGVESLNLKPGDISSQVGTLGIPEFGTRFVRQMLVETRPTTVSELIRISGLSHGTNVWTGNAQDLIKNKICTLSQVIATRDDIMIYLIRAGIPSQDAFHIMEQVRRGRGVTDEEAQLMRKCSVPEWYIESCRKISYMFPKAHAAAYVLMALRIAYFKVHYPAAFYAAYFTVRSEDVDADIAASDLRRCKNELKSLEAKGHDATAKERTQIALLEVMIEAMTRNIRFLPVDLYRSKADVFFEDEGGLRCPLRSLPGVGATAAQAIVDARNRPFTSIDDLRERTKISKAVAQVLKDHGALGDLPESDQAVLF